ncbi:hypothetical protein FACS1894170_03850 [Planctomycetales bacterium]|nr:hypothetical protein FACS1894170_03850 [Planctomycetales bacterium]
MKNKSGFTLIELLVVIVIIGILATIITAAVAGAIRSAKQARIGMEMSTIATALEMYKTEFGEYPPDFYDAIALVRHVKKRWPRFELPAGTDVEQARAIRQAMSNVYRSYSPASKTRWTGNANINFNFMTTPNTSIVALGLWLGGFPDDKTSKFVGFSADPEAPFGRKKSDGSVNIVSNINDAGTDAGWYDVDLGTPDKKTFIELEVGKNIVFVGERDGCFPCLAKKESENLYVPYVYFRGKSGGGSESYVYTQGGTKGVKCYAFTELRNSNVPATANWGDYGVVIAYAKDGNPFATPSVESTWVNAETYQLISPGLDTNFGIRRPQATDQPYHDGFYRSFNAGANKNTFGTHDLDNITNFSDFKPIKTIMK